MYLKSERYINKKRKKDSQLKEKNKVYLLIKNLFNQEFNNKKTQQEVEL